MKQFEDYKDGDLVTYKGSYEVYEAYKSKYTHNAFRLKKKDSDDIVADISEIRLLGEAYEKPIDLPRDKTWEDYITKVDSDADATGIYHVQD